MPCVSQGLRGIKRKKARTDLGSKEETQVTTSSTTCATCQTIFHLQRNFLGKAELNLAGQSGGLAEVDEVFEGEGKSDWLSELNRHVFGGVFHVGVLADGHGAVTNVTLAGEFDAFLCSFNDDCEEQSALAR